MHPASLRPAIRVFAVFTALALLAASANAGSLDAALFDRILQQHTRPVDDAAGVRVDYRGLARSDAWRELIANLAAADPDVLATRNARIAFWINAYNILAIDLIVTHQPVESIRDIGSLLRPVWKRTAGRVGGRRVSLAEIEHETLRPMGEARIHAALVCASTSCPPLKRTPWSAAELEDQLDAAMGSWLADRATGLRIDEASGTLWLSRVFDWFEADFAPSGGVLAFVRPYLASEARAWLARNPEPRIRYLPYDWGLNGLGVSGTRD